MTVAPWSLYSSEGDGRRGSYNTASVCRRDSMSFLMRLALPGVRGAHRKGILVGEEIDFKGTYRPCYRAWTLFRE